MSNESNAEWFVVHTYSGYENKVAANIEKIVENRGLQHLILETRIPTEIVVDSEEAAENYLSEEESFDGENDDEEEEVKKKRVKKEKKPEVHKLFPSYVLIKMVMNDESWHVIRNIRGVTGFVGPGSKPVALSEDEVAALGVETVSYSKINYNIGDSVIVVAGPLAGSIATVKSIDSEARRIKVLVMFGGKETSVDMNVFDVEALEQ